MSETPDATQTTIAPEKPRRDEMFSANELLAGGAALGALGVTTTVLVGATCPLCIVGAPALLAFGAAKKLRGKKPA